MNPLKFIAVAKEFANLSKDPSTKVAAIIVADDDTILSMGYNGFPRGVFDTEERYNDRPTKLNLIAHAETNAIAQAARHGVRLLDSTIILTALYPCSNCAKQIIQAGIKKVIAPKNHGISSNIEWLRERKISETMFKEAGVIVEIYE